MGAFSLELYSFLELLTLDDKKVVRNKLNDLISEQECTFVSKQEEFKPVKCPHCSSASIVKNGKNIKTEVQRYKCKKCVSFFSSTTGLAINQIQNKSTWVQYLKSLFNGEYYSIRKMAELFKISPQTSFRWRQKALYSISLSVHRFSGIVEIDDLHFKFSEKGRRGTLNNWAVKKAGDNDLSVKVLAFCDRVNTLKFSVVKIGRLSKTDLDNSKIGAVLNSQVNTIFSDKHPSIKAFTASIGIKHETFRAKDHVRDNIIHVNTLNEISSRLKSVILKKMKGVSTKYLENYVRWFKLVELKKYKNIDFYSRCFQDRSSSDRYKNREFQYQIFLEDHSKLAYNNPVKWE